MLSFSDLGAATSMSALLPALDFPYSIWNSDTEKRSIRDVCPRRGNKGAHKQTGMVVIRGAEPKH
jgi:hypothetical protein